MTTEYCGAYRRIAERALAGEFLDVGTIAGIVENDPETQRAFADIRDEQERGAVLTVEQIASRVRMPTAFVAGVARALAIGGPGALVGAKSRHAN